MFFHDGRFDKLEDAVSYMNDKLMSSLSADNQKAVVEFLQTVAAPGFVHCASGRATLPMSSGAAGGAVAATTDERAHARFGLVKDLA